MDRLMKQIESIDLTGTDIDYLTKNKAVLLKYKDLLECQSIFDAFGKYQNIILLFPIQSDYEGHFIAILKDEKTKTISHWDSYGLSPEQEISYTKNQYVKQRVLNNLYADAQEMGWKIIFNTFKLQSFQNNHNVCGRYCCLRVRMDYLDNKQFAKLFLNQKYSPDMLVSMLTFVALNEDEDYNEEKIIKNLLK